jgi:hypothetical protein
MPGCISVPERFLPLGGFRASEWNLYDPVEKFQALVRFYSFSNKGKSLAFLRCSAQVFQVRRAYLLLYKYI